MNYSQETGPGQPIETDSVSFRAKQGISTRWFTLGGLVGPVLFVLVFTIAGFLRPGYSAIYQVISDLGIGPNAWLLNSDLVIFGLLIIIFAIGFFYEMRTIISSKWLKASTVFLVFPGIGIASDAFFADDIFKNYPTTLHGILHALGFMLAFASFSIALIIIGCQLRGSPEWRKHGRYALITAFLTLVLGIGLRLLRIIGILTPATGGLTERFLLSIALSWYVVMGYRLFTKGQPRKEAKRISNTLEISSNRSGKGARDSPG